MLMNRVKEVRALPEYRLDIVFRNGERGVFDCNPYKGYECLAGIWADGVFDNVVADHGTVMWPIFRKGPKLRRDEQGGFVHPAFKVAHHLLGKLCRQFRRSSSRSSCSPVFHDAGFPFVSWS